MKKRILAGLLAAATIATCFTGCGAKKESQGLSNDGKELNIYVWNDEFKGFFEKYYMDKVPSDVKVNFITNDNANGVYQEKLDTALKNQSKAKAEDKVDLFLAEADFIKKYVNSDYSVDVKELGGIDMSNTYDYTVQAVTSEDGAVKGVSFQCCPGALIYRRSIAKEVFGTDDPAVIQEKLGSWEKFEAAAAEVKEKGYYMTGSYAETFRAFSNNVTSAWVDKDNKLVMDSQIEAWIDQSKMFMDKGYTLDSGVWDQAKTDQMYKDGKVLCFFGPAWYYKFSMSNAWDAEKGCVGDWAICEGPAAYFWGGTWLIGAAGTDNADLVKDIMDAFVNDQELCSKLVETEKQFSNNKVVNDKYAKDPNFGNEFLGGQNDTAVFADMAGNIKWEYATEYDQLLNEAVQGAMADYFKGSIDKEKALSNFYQSAKEKYSDIVTP